MSLSSQPPMILTDDWLEARCHAIDAAGRELALAVGQINRKLEELHSTSRDMREAIADEDLRRTIATSRALHDVQVEVQNGLFDCEHEIRSLRERDISPAELLVDGERLIAQYRFLRRRARVIDGLLAYLPAVNSHVNTCLDQLQRLREEGLYEGGSFSVPDCAFALIALEVLRDEESTSR